MAEHVLVGTAADLEVTFAAGESTDPVLLTATDAEGAVVVDAQPTVNEPAGSGRYTYKLPVQVEVATLTTRWVGKWGVAQSLSFPVEVVGAHLFSLAELRAHGDKKLASADPDTGYPDALLAEFRSGVTELFNDVCSVALIPMYGRTVKAWAASPILWADHTRISRVLSARSNGQALEPAALAQIRAEGTSRLLRPYGWFGDCSAGYRHGYEAAPWWAKLAAMAYCRELLVASVFSSRAITFSDDLGTTRFAVAGAKYPTGIPAVDAALDQYKEDMVVAP